MGVYSKKPERFLERLHFAPSTQPVETLCCAGFQFEAWRCKPFAKHLIEWLPDYALTEEELGLHQGNSYDRLCQAAVRVYTSNKYRNRGEAGEIALHAVCRDFFDTIPISPRVFYQSASNDVVKAFDMVHARFTADGPEIWLGESKLYQDRSDAIGAAIQSVQKHLDEGFLENQKLLLGPQIPKSTPRYDELRKMFASQTSLDKLIESAVIAIGILAESDGVADARKTDDKYRTTVTQEFERLAARLKAKPFHPTIRVNLIYIPLLNKDNLVEAFDRRLKGLTDD